MTWSFVAANVWLIGAQAVLVWWTGAGIPRWLERLAGRWWALILPVPITAVVFGIMLVPQLADGLTWLSLLLIPPGALLALGWAARGARPWLAAPGLLACAIAFAQVGTLVGDAAAALLSALSALTLGRLLAGLVPLLWLKLALLAMATIDAILVFGNTLQAPNATLNAAVPAPGLPQLQYLDLHWASIGYGDVFAAGVLGGILAAEGARQGRAALLLLALAWLFDLLFLFMDTLPATVPVAATLLIVEAARRRPARSLS